jgi:CheY-like chemotaxis protein
MINIVIVDDNHSNNIILQSLIEDYFQSTSELKYHIVMFEDSIEALEYLQENKKIDILFLDIVMPNLNGFDFLSRIRSNSHISQPIVIMATALGNKKFREKKKNLGANAYMIKPFTKKQVEVMFDNYLKKILTYETQEMPLCTNAFDLDTISSNIFLNEMKQNISHYKEISAYELVGQANSNEVDDILEDVDFSLFQLFDNHDSENIDQMNIELEESKEHLKVIFHNYKLLFEQYDELEDFTHIMVHLKNILENCKITNDVLAVSLIKYIMKELINYKENVFIDQEAKNIYYVLPILLDTTLQLESIGNKKL